MITLFGHLQAARPGPMLRGGTVVLLSRPHSASFFMAPHMSLASGPLDPSEDAALDPFEDAALDRVLVGPSVFQPQLLL